MSSAIMHGVLIAIREATFGAGQIVQRHDPPRSLAGRMGGIRVKKTGKHKETSRFSQGTHHRKMDLRSITSTSGITSQRQWQSFRDARRSFLEETSTGTPCQTMRRAHINEICTVAQLWSPATWSAKPVPSNPSSEGNTRQGHNGVQSRPDHILLSVDLTAPPVTIDVRSSHTHCEERCHELRDAANDKTNFTQELEKSDVNWNQAGA